MLSWQWPYLFALLPLPLLVRYLAPAIDNTAGAIRVPFFQVLQQVRDSQANERSQRWFVAVLMWGVWASLIVALARPTWVGDPIALPQDRRDLMLAVDISRSMLAEDMLVQNQYTDRITAVKAVVGEFVKKRQSDRLGLILFGEQSYLQTPLTYDSQTVYQQLQEAQSGFAGNATAIGDTIGLAIKRLRDRPADSRVLILLTDGANSAGTEPLQAADIAAEADIRIHTVGVGAEVVYRRDLLGRTRQSRAQTDLDEATLKAIADKTGGQYFRARDPNELQTIYAELDRLEPVPEEQTFRPTRSLSYWFLTAALGLMSLLMISIWRRD